MSDTHVNDKNYRRGAIMGLTAAEAFLLIAFALLLLLAFWQGEENKKNTPAVKEFRQLSLREQNVFLNSSMDGSIEAFIALSEKGVDFTTPASAENPKEKWRFIDKSELLRLMDAAQELPADVQRDLAAMVEAEGAKEVLSEMAALEQLIKDGKSLKDLVASEAVADAIKQTDIPLNELIEAAKILQQLDASGRTLQDVIETADAIQKLESAGQTLAGISGKIADAELQSAALVNALREELGAVVADLGGRIDDDGAITLPDELLFDRGKATIKPRLNEFLVTACEPWLSTLKGSGVNIAEVKIEGHASSEWSSKSSAREAYLQNLNLSQLRSQSVLRKCLSLVEDQELLSWARTHLIAVGYSSARLVLGEDGQEDRRSSRRVVLSATPDTRNLLEEIQTEAQNASYDRSQFGDWVDQNNDCLNTRHEVLRDQSVSTVQLSNDNCYVVRGKWRDAYSGKDYFDPSLLDIDHLVPIKWAWDRGAQDWSPKQKAEFFNDKSNLFVIESSLNQNKGAKGPDDWLPPSQDFRCAYVTRFIRVSTKYELLHGDELELYNSLQEAVCG
ncbi:MAG: DUF1524 domain-containing protein [Shimia sp.]|uniref:GmrSD restriction endonuclease domain-containing protein n=1 Tax=Shimia sp. TaxID=1954381 RepID=UPI003B8E8E51